MFKNQQATSVLFVIRTIFISPRFSDHILNTFPHICCDSRNIFEHIVVMGTLTNLKGLNLVITDSYHYFNF